MGGQHTIFSNPNSDLNIKDRTNAQPKRKNSAWKNKKRNRKTRHLDHGIDSIQELTYSWYHNGVLLLGSSDDVLDIRFGNSTQNDYGDYRCVVSKKNLSIASTSSRILEPGV